MWRAKLLEGSCVNSSACVTRNSPLTVWYAWKIRMIRVRYGSREHAGPTVNETLMLSMSKLAAAKEPRQPGPGGPWSPARDAPRLPACPGVDSRSSAAPSLVSAVHLRRWLDPNPRNVQHIVDKVEQLCGSSCRRGGTARWVWDVPLEDPW